jgi:SWI/SNF-related matrix-associated actin-dependent regulator 1 of chromatin subfamily A
MDLTKYNFLFEHQKKGVEFLIAQIKMGRILADDMGLGKTRQSTIAADILRKGGKVLIVCPATLKLGWRDEILKVLPDAKVFVFRTLKPKEELDTKAFEAAEWVIISFKLTKKYESLLLAYDYAVFIGDEAHAFKNPTAQRTKIAFGFSKRNKVEHVGLVSKCRYTFLLTGTPIVSRPLDLFPLLEAVKHPLGANKYTYGMRFCNGYRTRFGLDFTGASNLHILNREIQNVYLRRMKKDCLDLPAKTRRILPVEIDLNEYNKYWDDYFKAVIIANSKLPPAKRKNYANQHLVETIKLCQSAAIKKAEPTIELAKGIIEAGEKVIIFTNYTDVADALSSYFGEQAVCVVGGMSDKAKHEAVSQFQNNDKIRVFVGNLRAAGTGLTLTAATQVIMNDFSFVPAEHLQAEDRAMRIGQNNNVTITYMIAEGTIDTWASGLMVDKLEVISQAADGLSIGDNDVINDLYEMLGGQIK